MEITLELENVRPGDKIFVGEYSDEYPLFREVLRGEADSNNYISTFSYVSTNDLVLRIRNSNMTPVEYIRKPVKHIKLSILRTISTRWD
jgi:hypothetical protein